MISDIWILFISGCILLLPLAFWMYIFTSFFPYGVSRKQFIIWMIAGTIATIPFVYNDGFFSWNILRDVFFHLSLLWEVSTPFQLLASLTLFFTLFWIVFFLCSYFFQQKKKRFLSTFFIFSVFLFLLLSIWIYSISIIFPNFPWILQGIWIAFWDLLFVTVWWIISYYIIISLLEEGIKYMSSLSFSGRDEYFKIFQKYICTIACVALGFAFFENILYTYSFILKNGIDSELISLVLFRSIFSIILHIMSSMLFAFWFWFILNISWKYIQHLISFILVTSMGVISHIFFNASLTFGYIGYIFLYVIAIYIFISYLSTSFSNVSPDTLKH